jgi:hypothetical protein
MEYPTAMGREESPFWQPQEPATLYLIITVPAFASTYL